MSSHFACVRPLYRREHNVREQNESIIVIDPFYTTLFVQIIRMIFCPTYSPALGIRISGA